MVVLLRWLYLYAVRTVLNILRLILGGRPARLELQAHPYSDWALSETTHRAQMASLYPLGSFARLLEELAHGVVREFYALVDLYSAWGSGIFMAVGRRGIWGNLTPVSPGPL